MLHNWVSGIVSRGQYIPFSFADRSNLWPDEVDLAPSAKLGQRDFGSIADGLIAGTLVATELGWQPVEDLRTGDRVVTFDNGMRRLKSVRVSALFTNGQDTPKQVWPLLVPARALGNRDAIRVLPDQAVLIESDEGETLFGDPFTMVNAGVLDGFKGITRTPPEREMTLVTLEFEGDEVIYANGTMLMHCPTNRVEMVRSAEEMMTIGTPTCYQRLTDMQGRKLIAAMHAR